MIRFTESLTPEHTEEVKDILKSFLDGTCKRSAAYHGGSLTFSVGDVTYICNLPKENDRPMKFVDPEVLYLTAKCYLMFKNEKCAFWGTAQQIAQDFEEELEGFLK